VFPYRQGDFDVARAYWEEALGLFRELGDEGEIGRCLAELASVAVGVGDLDGAARQYQDSVEVFKRLGYDLRVAMALSNLGAIASMRGDDERAAEYFEEAIAAQRDLDRDGLGISLHNLARSLIKLGRIDEARATLDESLGIARELGYRELLGYCLGGAAELAAGAGERERAVRLLGASQAVFASIGVPIQGDEAVSQASLTAELRTSLGDDVFDALLAEGRTADTEAVAAGAIA
jgi:tetratricopeptide (TPR) repeat protein